MLRTATWLARGTGGLVLVVFTLALARAQPSTAPPADQVAAARQQFHVVHDLAYDWVVFDRKYQRYVPYLRERHAQVSSISVPLTPASYAGNQLVLYAEAETFVFINATLQRRLPARSWAWLAMDSLRLASGNQAVLLTLYSPAQQLPPAVALVGSRKTRQQATVAVAAPLALARPRVITDFGNFVVLTTLLLLASFAFLRRLQPKTFIQFYSARQLVNHDYRDGSVQISKPLNGVNLLFLFNHALLLSLLYLLLREGSTRLSVQSWLRVQNSFADYAFNFLLVAAILFLLLMAKYLATYVLGKMFGFDKLINVHYYEFTHYSTLFFTLLLLPLLGVFVSFPTWLPVVNPWWIYAIVGFNLLRMSLLTLHLRPFAERRNLYLISYLCATELLPLLTGMKLLLG